MIAPKILSVLCWHLIIIEENRKPNQVFTGFSAETSSLVSPRTFITIENKDSGSRLSRSQGSQTSCIEQFVVLGWALVYPIRFQSPETSEKTVFRKRNGAELR